MATKAKQNIKQVNNDEGNNNNNYNFVVPENIIAERKECFKTSMSGVAILTNRRHLHSIRSTCLPFGEKSDKHRWSLSLSEETERDLLNETPVCSRCVESRSKSPGNTRLDGHQQNLMQHKKSCTDFRPVNLNSEDTRLVDGLLTTTFCSTEL